MKKIIKIPISIALVAVLACSLVLPSFALSSAISGAVFDYDSPFFCEDVTMAQHVFGYNAQGGVTSTYLFDFDVGEYWGSQSWYTGQNFAEAGFCLEYTDYDGEIVVMSNSTTFVMPEDFSDYPVLYIEFPIDTILGNPSVRCVGGYVTPDNVSHDLDFTYYTTVYNDEGGVVFDYVDTSSSFVALSIPAGSYVNVKYIVSFDASLSAGSVCNAITRWNSSDVFVRDYRPSISVESVDVLSWLPTTIDAFLNVEVLPGVDFGTLLLMVIAVPALFAVLKMLGGGG